MLKSIERVVVSPGPWLQRRVRFFHGSMPLNTVITLDEKETSIRNFLIGTAQYYGKKNNGTVPVLRFAGGWVRDKLMGGESKDIDVAIDCMTGKEFYGLMKEYSESGELKDSTVDVLGRLAEIKKDADKSKHLETATTRLFGLDLDLVNLRTETYHEDSRNPEMQIGTAEEDALRRDATINSLFYNLNTEKVEDFSGKGLQDLESHIIRTPLDPEQTFRDDPLRILRLIRFACRFDFVIEDNARHWMKDASIHEALRHKISRERILVELQKMLQGPHPKRALDTILDCDLFFTIFSVPDTASAFEQEQDANETEIVSKSSQLLDQIINDCGSENKIRDHLLSTKQEQYWSWIMCSFLPWIRQATPDQDHNLPAKEIARNGLKMDNDTLKIIANAQKFAAGQVSEICSRFSDSQAQVESPGSKRKRMTDDRVITGLGIRTWGQHWRSVVIAALLIDASRTAVASEVEAVKRRYDSWLQFIARENLGDVWNPKVFKPVADGGEIMKSVKAKLGNVAVGPWMQECVMQVFKYQLQEADSATKEGGLKAVHDMIESGQIKVQTKPAK